MARPTVQVTMFWTADMDREGKLFPAFVQRTRGLLERHGFDLQVSPHRREKSHVLDFSDEVINFFGFMATQTSANDMADQNVRGKVTETRIPTDKRVVVIFGRLGSAMVEGKQRGVNGHTVRANHGVRPFPNYCIVDLERCVNDNTTSVMLHEICHCANAEHEDARLPEDVMDPNRRFTRHISHATLHKLRLMLRS
jgi:hypothetical protein